MCVFVQGFVGITSLNREREKERERGGGGEGGVGGGGWEFRGDKENTVEEGCVVKEEVEKTMKGQFLVQRSHSLSARKPSN